MNLSILINSFRYIKEFKSVLSLVSLSSWIYQELCIINYNIDKLQKIVYKYDLQITESIIHLITDKALLSKLSVLLICQVSVSSKFEKFKLLFEHGADIHIEDDLAVRVACSIGDIKILKLLLQQGANIHINNNRALINACAEGYTKIVKILIKAGADIHAKDDSPLLLSIYNNHIEILKILIEAGANIKDRIRLAIDIATSKNYTDIVELLNKIDKQLNYQSYIL